MRLIAAMTVVGLLALFSLPSTSRADVPPPYEVHDIGATLDEAEPYPSITDVLQGGPADKAGVKKGDGVIAIDGRYSKGGGPFYMFARGLQGPRNTFVTIIVLREQYKVLTFKVKRTHRRG